MGLKKEYNKAWMDAKRAEYKGYSVYLLPKEKYVGMSCNVYNRVIKHKCLGRNVEGAKVLISFENPKIAHLVETILHCFGYKGYRP